MDARTFVTGIVLAAGMWLGASGSASALSCDGRLVTTGDSEAYVRSVCGEPTAFTTRTETRTMYVTPYGVDPRTGYGIAYGYAQTVTVQIDVLVYDFGPTRFIDELTFENGVLRADRVAGYGTVAAQRARRESRRAARERGRTDD
jgi:hypothetical protein